MSEKSLDMIRFENQELRARLEEAEDALRAIRSGEVDALVVYGPEGEKIYTLQGAEHAYRIMVESISEGAATLLPDGTLLYCNNRLAEMLGVPLETLPGTPLTNYVSERDIEIVERLLDEGLHHESRGEITLQTRFEHSLPVLLSVNATQIDDGWGLCLIATDLTIQKRDEEILAAERLARSILDQAAEAIVVCDTGGTVIRASQLARQMSGQSPLFRPFVLAFPLIQTSSRSKSTPFSIRQVLRGSEFRGIQAHLVIPQSETPTYLLVNAAPLRNHLGEIIGCVVTLTDVTERKQAEMVLEQANEQLKFFLESITDAYVEYDQEWRWVAINSAAERLYFQNRRAADLIGKVIFDEYPALVEEETFRRLQQAVAENQPVHFETCSHTLDRWLEIHAYPRNGHCYVYSRDITERKRAEEEAILSRAQAELQHRLMDQREKERQQIARDIHDGPLQELTGIALALQGAVIDSNNPIITETLILLRETLENQIRELRTFAGELRPPALFHFGLGKAIQSHLEGYQKNHPEVNVYLEANPDGLLSPEPVRLALFRIYQESLNNIAKHALASEISISIRDSTQAIELSITDNGQGFEVPTDWIELARRGHLGLVGMRERAEAIGAQFRVTSKPGQGTTVSVRVPLTNGEEINPS